MPAVLKGGDITIKVAAGVTVPHYLAANIDVKSVAKRLASAPPLYPSGHLCQSLIAIRGRNARLWGTNWHSASPSSRERTASSGSLFSCMANRNEPGYRSPKQKRCQTLTVRLLPEINDAMTQATARAGISKQDAIEDFCVRFARKHGVVVPRTPDPH